METLGLKSLNKGMSQILFCPSVMGIGPVLFTDFMMIVFLTDSPARVVIGVQNFFRQRVPNP